MFVRNLVWAPPGLPPRNPVTSPPALGLRLLMPAASTRSAPNMLASFWPSHSSGIATLFGGLSRQVCRSLALTITLLKQNNFATEWFQGPAANCGNFYGNPRHPSSVDDFAPL